MKKTSSQKASPRGSAGKGKKQSTSQTLTPNSHPLLLEIGCEEIPARFLAGAERELGERLTASLRQVRLIGENKSPVKTYSTPRRLIAYVPSVLARQPDQSQEIVGPPVKVAFDAEGKPTRAALSFAEKNGLGIADLTRISTPKGEYLAARKTVEGRLSVDILAQALAEIVTKISFPKSMYWTAKAGPRFIRPIRSILALVGEGKGARVVPFEIAGVPSGNATFGHRLANTSARASSRTVIPAKAGIQPKIGDQRPPLQVFGFADDQKKLRAAKVEIDSETRRQTIRAASKVLLEHSERLVEDEELETWHVNSAEWPSAIRGEFDRSFLKLPREILITVMRDHQKYFAVEDGKGNLKPGFIAILNREDDPKGVIRSGHERVLRARFTDAQFFWDADQKSPLRDRLPRLEKVTYHEKLGSYADKVRRMEAIAREICDALAAQDKLPASASVNVFRAIQLCKCDLTTQMVQEFTELQGVVGGLYAKAQLEPPEVADAIYDHYKPLGLEDSNPKSAEGAIVSLADKLDSIVAGFGAGLEPTGSSDPFGLRRAGNGAVKIAAEALPGLDLLGVTRKLVVAHSNNAPKSDTMEAVCGFLQERAEFYLRTSGGLRGDTVRAIILSGQAWSPPSDALLRGKQLEPFVTTDAFQALAIAAKRTRNILSKSATQADRGIGNGIQEHLLAAGPERELFEAYRMVKEHLEDLAAQGKYGDAFKQVATMRPLVDRFFDKVMVMDENPELRANRLRLLDELNALVFLRFADLSQIESNTSIVGAPTLV